MIAPAPKPAVLSVSTTAEPLKIVPNASGAMATGRCCQFTRSLLIACPPAHISPIWSRKGCIGRKGGIRHPCIPFHWGRSSNRKEVRSDRWDGTFSRLPVSKVSANFISLQQTAESLPRTGSFEPNLNFNSTFLPV